MIINALHFYLPNGIKNGKDDDEYFSCAAHT